MNIKVTEYTMDKLIWVSEDLPPIHTTESISVVNKDTLNKLYSLAEKALSIADDTNTKICIHLSRTYKDGEQEYQEIFLTAYSWKDYIEQRANL